MPMTVMQKGNFDNTYKSLGTLRTLLRSGRLDECGREGVAALAAATPVDTGKTASSWSYKIERRPDHISIGWYNDNKNEGYSIALLIQYGHVVWNGKSSHGTYVDGIDYINPAIQPVMEKLINEIGEEVS